MRTGPLQFQDKLCVHLAETSVCVCVCVCVCARVHQGDNVDLNLGVSAFAGSCYAFACTQHMCTRTLL